MAGDVTVDALIQPAPEPLLEPIKPKKRTWSERQKRKISFLAADIVALERLVGTLLSHLERATQPDCTEEERIRYRAMVHDIRGVLADGEAERAA
jgi:hypothetical protein